MKSASRRNFQNDVYEFSTADECFLDLHFFHLFFFSEGVEARFNTDVSFVVTAAVIMSHPPVFP